MNKFISSIRIITINHLLLILAVTTTFFMSSCQSREAKVLSQMKGLTERIDKKGNEFTSEDWGKTFQKLEDISKDMEKCNFSEEQYRELGEIEGRLVMMIVKDGSRTAGKSISNYIRGAGSFLKGFEQGSSDSYEENKEEFDKIGDEVLSDIRGAIDDISE